MFVKAEFKEDLIERTKKYSNYKEEMRFENLRIFELAGVLDKEDRLEPERN